MTIRSTGLTGSLSGSITLVGQSADGPLEDTQSFTVTLPSIDLGRLPIPAIPYDFDKLCGRIDLPSPPGRDRRIELPSPPNRNGRIELPSPPNRRGPIEPPSP